MPQPFLAADPSPAQDSRSSDRPEQGGDAASRLLPSLIRLVESGDALGAPSGLKDWLDANGRRVQGYRELAGLATLLIDHLAERERQPCPDAPAAPAAPAALPEPFAVSTHFSLLTAAVLRQREQIRQLVALVDALSRRIG